ncbi:hypothetical protein O4H49_04005 [Kiloniella laminariae]|uniref:Ig-like domain-containing protein n=1 Tax=Kiloniella laminariae TaxID=454162 RepID=A0ABT4LFQ5_9PROT|nr:hypothetical protein [Kiloniella laminariae]MCZ4279928.1 hypothetical protein [Kiloniella laminariae]
MNHKFPLLLAATLLGAALQFGPVIQTATAKELTAKDCPMGFGATTPQEITQLACERQTSADRKTYNFIGTWFWDEGASFGRLYYKPIKSFQVWRQAPNISKKDVYIWPDFENIKEESMQEIACDGYKCYSFLFPEAKSSCLWFYRDLVSGKQASSATDIVTGFACTKEKDKTYSPAEAMAILRKIKTK